MACPLQKLGIAQLTLISIALSFACYSGQNTLLPRSSSLKKSAQLNCDIFLPAVLLEGTFKTWHG
jgi:hypothetical protein